MPKVSQAARDALAQSVVDLSQRPDQLFNDRKPYIDVIEEKPEHRLMVILKSQGFSNAEIATYTDYTRAMVNLVLRQPWARTRLLQLLEEKQQDPAEALLRASVVDNISTLIEVRDDEASGGQARIAAANSLLDRYLGKPVQRLESRNMNVNVSPDELDRQIASLEQQEQAILGRRGSAGQVSAGGASTSPLPAPRPTS